MSEKIMRAINQMDPDNDNHWTVDGLARLETVKFLAGESVSREELDAAAPGFNRESYRAYRLQTPMTPQPSAGNPPGTNPSGLGGNPGTGQLPGSPPPDEKIEDTIARKFGDAHRPRMNVEYKVETDPPTPIEAGLETPVDADGNRSGIDIELPEETGQARDMPPFTPVDADGYRTGYERPLHVRNMGPAIKGMEQEDAANGEIESPVDADGNRAGIGHTTASPEPKEREPEPQKPRDPRSEGREDEIKALAEKIDNENKTVDELQRVYIEAGKKLKEAQGKRDELVDRRNVIVPKDEDQKVIQEYLEAQKKQLVARAKAINQIKESGVNLKQLAKMTSPAPLDQALKTRASSESNMSAALHHARIRNKKRRDFLRFKGLVTTPVSGSLVMPACGNIGVSSPIGGVQTVTIGPRIITTPALAANQVYNIGWIERGKTVVSTSPIFILDEWHRPYKVMG